jgi:hypothetical protein
MIADIYINKNGVLIQFLLVWVSPIWALFLNENENENVSKIWPTFVRQMLLILI